jgi:hypothetical protein
MVYNNTQIHLVYGLRSSSRILNNYETTFHKLDPFLSSGEGRKTPTLLGPFERANLIQ